MEPDLIEYQSLREESAQARNAQQTILQWSLGAFSLVFAAALSTSTSATPAIERLRMAVFAFALPFLVIGSCLAWVGELIRMRRVGSYLRGRERTFWPEWEDEVQASFVRDRTSYPLLWENYIASKGPEPGQHKQWEGYLGAALIYGGAYVVSLAVFMITLWAHRFGIHQFAWRAGGTAYAITLTLGCAWMFSRSVRRVRLVSEHVAGSASSGRPGGRQDH